MAFAKDDNLAPYYGLFINGQNLAFENVTDAVTSVEYESVDGMADVASFTVLNPNNRFNDKKLFAPGNEMDIYMGYQRESGKAGEPSYIGRVQLVEPEFDFPSSGTPTLKIKGYTKDHVMMDNSPVDVKKLKHPVTGKKIKAKAPPREINQERTVLEAVRQKALAYNMHPDITEPSAVGDNTLLVTRRRIIQKAGMSDYNFVRGLANYTNCVFWVDYDISLPPKEPGKGPGQWVLHFKVPEEVGMFTGESRIPQKVGPFQFRYRPNGNGNLLSFRPRLYIQNRKTGLKVAYITPSGKEYEVETAFERFSETIDAKYKGDPTANVKIDNVTGGQVRVIFGDFAVTVITDKTFQNTKQLAEWAKNWFRKTNESFVIAEGTVVGTPKLMARQVHFIKGFGGSIDGHYYFSRVRHVMSGTNGYITEFTARKIVNPLQDLPAILELGARGSTLA